MTVDLNALYDNDAYEMDERLGEATNASNTITVAASVVEAWSTGDADILEHPMMDALIKAQEEITAEGSTVKRREIVIVVTA